jgi:protein-tyrosine phosphatase
MQGMEKHPMRLVRLQGAMNFRDLGGYAGREGRPVRWRRLFRSDHLGRLTQEDHASLADLGLHGSIDFRGLAERAASPYQLPGVVQHSLAIEPTVVQEMVAVAAAGRELTGPIVVALMEDLYRSLVNDQASRFGELFQQILRAEGPLVFHCTAGKDRTGVAAALILLALGVSREQVMQDYLLTNQLLELPGLVHSDTPLEALRVLWRVQESFLDAALDAIEAEHGEVDRYLTDRLGLTRAALDTLVDRYLES